MSETPKNVSGGTAGDPMLPTEGLVLSSEAVWDKIWTRYMAVMDRNEIDISRARRVILSPEDFDVELQDNKLIIAFHYSNKLQVAENYFTEPGGLPRFINEAFDGAFLEVIVRVKNQDSPGDSHDHRRVPSVNITKDPRYMSPG